VISAILAVAGRELRLAARQPAEWAQAPVFYLVVVTLFTLTAAPRDPALAVLAPSVVWVGALLSALLGIERMFRSDLDDGNLEQLLLSPTPTPLLVAAKIGSHWLLTAAPLVLIGPLAAVALGMGATGCWTLLWTLLLGTPTLMLIGGFAAALTVGVPRAGLLLPILVLPLMAPVAVFAGGAVRAAVDGLPFAAPLYFLAAELVLALTLLPWAASAALRNALE